MFIAAPLLRYIISVKMRPLGFAIDIDGTLTLSHQEIPNSGASKTLNLLTRLQIPFVFLTNNIAKSELHKAQELNHILKLEQPIKKEQIILNYTPLRPILKKIQHQPVLIIGREKRIQQMLPLPEIPLYITIEEYCTIFPQSVPLSMRQQGSLMNDTKQRVMKRLGVQVLDKCKLNFSAIWIQTAPLRWEECYQIIIDHLSTTNGSITSNKFYSPVKHIPVFSALNDLYFITRQHHLPRMLLKPFNDGLRSIYKCIYGQQLQMKIFGKPAKQVYDFTYDHMQQHFGKIEKIVMIGDNIETDIQGAREAGWDSILVKTGVAIQDCPFATINSETISEGVQKYLKDKKMI